MGDEGELPRDVVLDAIEFPSPSRYDITDALISANGAIRISADARTRVYPTSGGPVQATGRAQAERRSWLAPWFFL